MPFLRARAKGWPESQLHYEFFSAELVKSDADGSFEVQIASSGRIVVVAKDQTVVSALREAGIEVPTSCEQGVCGTCLTRALKGVPDHRDAFLTTEEQAANDQFTVGGFLRHRWHRAWHTCHDFGSHSPSTSDYGNSRSALFGIASRNWQVSSGASDRECALRPRTFRQGPTVVTTPSLPR
jgi:ferredoxin